MINDINVYQRDVIKNQFIPRDHIDHCTKNNLNFTQELTSNNITLIPAELRNFRYFNIVRQKIETCILNIWPKQFKIHFYLYLIFNLTESRK